MELYARSASLFENASLIRNLANIRIPVRIRKIGILSEF